MANKEALDAIDKQIVSWVEQLDKLYEQRQATEKRMTEIEQRLASMREARRSLAAEWGEPALDLPIPLKYTNEGVTDAIANIFEVDESLTVDEIVSRLKAKQFNFEQKNPRRVVNMALVNSPDFTADGTGKYSFIGIPEDIIEPEDLPFKDV